LAADLRFGLWWWHLLSAWLAISLLASCWPRAIGPRAGAAAAAMPLALLLLVASSVAIPPAASSSSSGDRIGSQATRTTPRFSNVFQPHMVLQRGRPLRLFGPGKPMPGMQACFSADCAPVIHGGAMTTDGGSGGEGGGRVGWWTASLPALAASAAPASLTLRRGIPAPNGGGKGHMGGVIMQELHDVVIGDVFLVSGQSNIDIPQTYGHQIYTPRTLPGCQPQNDSNRGCSSFNTTAQMSSEAFADELGRSQGLLRLMIVGALPANANVTPAAELPPTPDCVLCPPPTTPYVACGCDSMRWARANASNIRGFSATAFFTGQALLPMLPDPTVPIGLVRSSMGGTQIQLWSSPAALAHCNTTVPAPTAFWRPYSSLFWTMILPFRGLSFAALIWWQGEANVGPDRATPSNWGTGPTGPLNYACQLPAMLRDWRKQLHMEGLPVLVIELSGFCNEFDTHTFLTHCDQHRSHLTATDTHLPALRLAQHTGANTVPDVHVIANHDLGSIHPVSGSIHSSRKPELGVRVARALRGVAYRQHGGGTVVWAGPRALSAGLDPGCDTCVLVTFSTVAGSGGLGLDPAAACPTSSNSGRALLLPVYCNSTEIARSAGGFELMMDDGAWHAALSVELGSSTGTVLVRSTAAAPTRVRYAFADWPVTSVRNSHGDLPAHVFDLPVSQIFRGH
jgi:hypothetical protein